MGAGQGYDPTTGNIEVPTDSNGSFGTSIENQIQDNVSTLGNNTEAVNVTGDFSIPTLRSFEELLKEQEYKREIEQLEREAELAREAEARAQLYADTPALENTDNSMFEIFELAKQAGLNIPGVLPPKAGVTPTLGNLDALETYRKSFGEIQSSTMGSPAK